MTSTENPFDHINNSKDSEFFGSVSRVHTDSVILCCGEIFALPTGLFV